MPIQALTIAELSVNPIVLMALEQAWTDSLPADAARRHEEGGWVFMDVTTGDIAIQRATAGLRSAIDLDAPPTISGSVVIATFHTHPNPSSEGWDPSPSFDDTESAWLLGVPCLIRADDGVHTTGPDSRRGGLGGPPGFPT